MGAAHARPLQLNELPTGSLGIWADIYVEEERSLSLDEAQTQLREGKFKENNKSILSEGIGAKPRWLHFGIENGAATSLPLKLVVGTTWTDNINVYLVHDGQTTASWQTGDELPSAPELTPGIGYTISTNFLPGHSDLYLRVESVDPFVFPIELMTENEAHSQEDLSHYSYGVLFGFLFALTSYNTLLYFGLRKRSYIYYALYLTSLTLLILSFTGHGSAWFWPEQPQIQRYVILVMMVFYGCSGLLFASRFLEIKKHFPNVLKLIQAFAALGVFAIAFSIILGSQLAAALIAFIFVAIFSLLMVFIGLLSIRAHQASGPYFFIAALFGILGSTSTTLAVWGWIPFTSLTYHAIEYGMLIEATLFALALSHHYNKMSESLAKINALNNQLSKEVTERKLIEKSLLESEDRYRTLVDWSPNAIAVHRDGKLLYANPSTIKMFGAKTAQDLVGKPVLERIHPDFHQITLERIRNNAKDGLVATPIEEKFIKLDGTVFDVEVQGKAIVYDGEPAIHTTIRDISERKLIDSKLRMLSVAVEQNPASVMITDLQSRIEYINPTFTEATGYSPEEAIGQTPNLISSGETPDEIYEQLWGNLSRGEAWKGELKNKRKNGELFWEETYIAPVKDSSGNPQRYVAVKVDVTVRKRLEDEVRQLAFFDVLTKLPNRRLLSDRLAQAMVASKRGNYYGALMFLDLDNFKPLNDTHGHVAGDMLLVDAANRIKSCVREMDTVARFGGDEFVVMLSELDADKTAATEQARLVAEKILSTLSAPYSLEVSYEERPISTVVHHCTASIGVAMFINHEGSQDDILKWADAAMYQAKDAGRNSIRFYEPHL